MASLEQQTQPLELPPQPPCPEPAAQRSTTRTSLRNVTPGNATRVVAMVASSSSSLLVHAGDAHTWGLGLQGKAPQPHQE